MEQHCVKPGEKVRLETVDPDDRGKLKGKKEKGEAELAALRLELDRLQEVLYAERKHKLLVVLQAMDTAGKDGTIRSVFEGVNPQGVQVASFKAPTPVELDHDYLWRVHTRTPGKGEIVIFNRSHYEDVLVVRVHNLAPEAVWRRRYQQINEFEHLLAQEGTTILKFYLHIDLAEQKKRLLERLDDPAKQWKFSAGDMPERKLWPQYMAAYEDVLNLTSTEWAPWYVVPANHNWYRNLVVASVIVDALKKLKMSYPPAPGEGLLQYKQQLLSEP